MALRDHDAMMTQQLQASIISAPLAATDRRALSQAWYSALGYARANRTPGVADLAVKSAAALPAAHRAAPQAATPKRCAALPASRALPTRRVVAQRCAQERRASRTLLARKIVQAFGNTPPGASARATFRLQGPRGRVHVVLQTCGNRVRLVALCASKQRAAVTAALRQAAYALAPRGIMLDVVESDDPACS